ncbi:hypothetical protein [Thauera sp. SDU_THAU2]|uniref:hypothetical protein n=1 Tax=Thauera sp. SDU_THAU2 TaxID=3136633 RepID=UPI00311EC701
MAGAAERLAQIPRKRYANANKRRKVKLFPHLFPGRGFRGLGKVERERTGDGNQERAGAFERANPEVRARIYQSARNALEAGLRKQEINDPETIAAQRHRLEATIHQIEAEERVAPPAVEPVRDERLEPAGKAGSSPDTGDTGAARAGIDGRAPATATGGGSGNDGGGRGDERYRRDPPGPRGRFSAGGVAQTPASARTTDFRPERVAKARKRRGRFFSFLLVAATLIAGFGTAAWWVQTSGLLDPLPDEDGSGTVSGGSFSGEDPLKRALDTQSRFSAEWREIFSPPIRAAFRRVRRAGRNPSAPARGRRRASPRPTPSATARSSCRSLRRSSANWPARPRPWR